MLRQNKPDIDPYFERRSRYNIMSYLLTALLVAMMQTAEISAVASDAQAQITKTVRVSLTAEEQAWLKQHPNIQLGCTTGFEPALIENPDGSYSGILVDILNEMNQRLGTNIGLEISPWKQVIDKAKTKKTDGILAILGEYADSLNLLKTRPYVSVYPAIFAQSHMQFHSMDDLEGKRIAVVDKTYFSEKILNPYKGRVEIISLPTAQEAMRMVFENKADAMIGLTLNNYWISRYMFTGVVPVHVLWDKPMDLVIGVRSDWPELLSILNKGINSFSEDELNAIVTKWVGSIPKQPDLKLTAEEHAWLREHPVLSVAVDPAWAPVEFLNNKDNYDGISISYLEHISEMLGVRFVFVQENWQTLVEMAKRNDLDMFSSLTKTPERKKFLTFTEPYLNIPIAVFAGKGVTYIHSLNDLAGKKVAVVKDYAIHELLTSWYPQIELVPVPNIETGLKFLTREQVFAFVGNILTTGYMISQKGFIHIKIVGETPFTNAQTMAVRKDWPILRDILQKALGVIPETKKNEIYRQWMSVTYEKSFDYSLLWRIGFGIFILFGLFVFWNRWLIREVRRRTSELRKERDFNTTLIQTSPAFFIAIDTNGKTILMNRAMSEALGYDQDDVTGMDYLNTFIPEADQEALADLFKQIIEMKKKTVNENRILTRESNQLLVEWHSSPVIGPDGEVEYFIGVGIDITERKRIEQALRLTQYSVDHSRSAIVWIDRGGWFKIINQAFCDYVGYSREELLSMKVSDIDILWSHKKWDQNWNRWKNAMSAEILESRFRRKNGSVFPAEVAISYFCFEEQEAMFAFVTDITERKAAKSAKHESDKRFKLLVESGFDGVFIYINKRVVEVNQQMADILGRDRQSLVGEKTIDWLTPESQEKVRENIGKSHANELDFIKSDGTIVHTESFARVCRFNNQGARIVAVRDVTQRKRTEKELARYRDHLEELVQKRTKELEETSMRYSLATRTARLGIWDWDVINNILFWDEGMYELYGVHQSDFGGIYETWVKTVHPDDIEQAKNEVQSALQGKESFDTEFRIVRPDNGLVRYIKAHADVYMDEEGNANRMIGVNWDITKIKQFENELLHAKEAAEAANLAKSTFLANMSHELRTPLNAILGFSQLMERDYSLSQGHRENLNIINRSGEHLLNLINDVLDMSKIEAGRIEIHRQSFDFRRMLKSIENMIHLRAARKNLKLSFISEPDVPQHIKTDERKLHQILINLLENAVKFTGQGQVILRVMADSTVADQHPSSFSLHFQVEDTGPGIGPEEMDGLFAPFVQTGGGGHEGTGLGLTISRKFAQLLGGDIRAESQVGKGSMFFFHIRADLPDMDEIRTEQTTRRVVGIKPDQPKYRILVVEDKRENRLLLCRLLESAGFEVQEAVNGLNGVELFEKWQPHLIWMDILMPVMDGYEATREIRDRNRGQSVVIIALTASAFKEDREKVLAAGCNDFVRKPFRENDIFDAMSKHLRVRFVYEDLRTADEQRHNVRTDLKPDDLAMLSHVWRNNFYEVTIRGQFDKCLELIEQIRPGHAELADCLTKLVQEFRFDKLMELMQDSGRSIK